MSKAAEARLADPATEFWNRPSVAGRDGPVLNLLEHVKPSTAAETSKVGSYRNKGHGPTK